MKPEDILDAVGGIGAEKIEAAHKAKQGQGRVWRRWAAAAAAFALVVGGVAAARQVGRTTLPAEVTEPPVETAPLTPSPTEEPARNGGAATPYLLAAAVYPDLPDYPKDQFDAEAMMEWSQANLEWRAQNREQGYTMDSYRGALDDYLRQLLPALLTRDAGENKVCSPLNLYLALAMLSEAAGGESRAQLLALLGAEDVETLRTRAKALWLNNYTDGGVSKCVLSSSLWANQAVEFVEATLDRLAQGYYADVYRGETGSEAFSAALRDWLNSHTGGLLEDYVSDIELTPETILALVTAIDYHASWLQPEFDPAATENGVFHAPEGEQTAEFMHQTLEATDYFWGQQFTATVKELDLGNTVGGLSLILPDEGVSPEALLEDPEVLDFLLTNKRDYQWSSTEVWPNSANVRLNLSLPKFDIRQKTDLIGTLQALGVTDVFQPGLADFSPTVVNQEELQPYIARAEHAARVSIDEAGVTGATYTILDMRAGGGPPAPEREVDFTLDRPFLFAVTGPDGLPLFVGIVNQP